MRTWLKNGVLYDAEYDVHAYVGQRDRKEAWRLYEEWRLRKELVLKTRQTQLPAGWDAHLQPETYQEPEGTAMPPVDVTIGHHGGSLMPGRRLVCTR